MYLNFFSKVLNALVMVIIVSCSKKDNTALSPSGSLILDIGISVAAFNVYNPLKTADLDAFIIGIYNLQDEVVEQYNGASEIPESIELPEGTYYATAHSDNNLPAEFDNPYYFGSSGNFTITAGQTTSSTITCTLSNIMVTVIYEENVIQDFTGYSTSVSNSAGSLVFGMNETRAGFFDEGPLHIESDLSYSDNEGNVQTRNLSGDIAGAETGKHYEIHIDASLSDGNALISLNVDETYETEIVTLSDMETEMSGELLITEIMYNPSALTDTEGEYIEVKNVSDQPINLMGLVIRRGSNNNLHVIGDDLPLLPGEFALLGRSDTATAEVDYVYSNISLINTGDEIYINAYGTDGTDGAVICMVDYGAPGFNTSLSGISIQLDPTVTDVNDALLGTNWCESSTAYSTGDLGTPGTENELCE
jgi:hypothetical protein